jgi:hypothetical protein
LRPASRKKTQVPWTDHELPQLETYISTSFPRYAFPNCSIPGASTLRSTFLVHILRAIPQYHALICLGIPLFDTFPLPSPADGALEAAPPPTSSASSDRHPNTGVKGHRSLCGSIRFDRLATNVAALHFSLAGQFLHTSRLARPNCP